MHHSTVDSIRKDAEKHLAEYFESKSLAVGRPKASVPQESDELKQLKAEVELYKKEHAIAVVKAEYAELRLKQEKKRNEEERRKKHLKKKKKKR